MKIIRSFTLVEVLLVVAIFTVFFFFVLDFLLSSQRASKSGDIKINEQQQARLAIYRIKNVLQESNYHWEVNNTTYPVTISQNGRRIDFYIPEFYPDCCPQDCSSIDVCKDSANNIHSLGEIEKLVKVSIKLDSTAHQIVKKVGLNPSDIVAKNVEDLSFSWADADNNSILVEISIKEKNYYNISSLVKLRNNNINLANETVEIEEPGEGEF